MPVNTSSTGATYGKSSDPLCPLGFHPQVNWVRTDHLLDIHHTLYWIMINNLPFQGWKPDNNSLIPFVYFRCGGQQDVKDVSETTKNIQMTRIAPDTQVPLDQLGTRMTGKLKKSIDWLYFTSIASYIYFKRWWIYLKFQYPK